MGETVSEHINRNKRLLHIYSCRGVGIKTIDKLYECDPSLRSIFQMTKTELMHDCKLHEKLAITLYEDLRKPIDELLQYDYEACNYITRFDDTYPVLLREIYDPPWVLFYKGNLSLLREKRTLAVVGTRHPTREARPIMKALLLPLIRKGWCIVSGLAYGVDAIAHQLALEANGSTIAVLGSGLESIYPKEHRNLSLEIAERHLLVSEFLPNQHAQKWQFPLRNRIISGLTCGTLVIEAKERSGSLITADQALEQGREVFAVPGSILNNNSKGTNYLIQQGAKLVICSDDIENELYLTNEERVFNNREDLKIQ